MPKLPKLPTVLLATVASFLPINSVPASDNADWRVRTVEMQPVTGHFAEFCMQLAAGQSLEVELSADESFHFNIHVHTETKTLFPVRETVPGDASYSVPADPPGEYCLMFETPDGRTEKFPVDVRYRSN